MGNNALFRVQHSSSSFQHKVQGISRLPVRRLVWFRLVSINHPSGWAFLFPCLGPFHKPPQSNNGAGTWPTAIAVTKSPWGGKGEDDQ